MPQQQFFLAALLFSYFVLEMSGSRGVIDASATGPRFSLLVVLEVVFLFLLSLVENYLCVRRQCNSKALFVPSH